MASSAGDEVAALRAAQEEAAGLIRAARAERESMLRSAREQATRELSEWEAKQRAAIDADQSDNKGDDRTTDELKQATDDTIAKDRKHAEQNHDNVLELLESIVTSPDGVRSIVP